MILGIFNVNDGSLICELNKDPVMKVKELASDSNEECDAIFLNWIKTEHDKKNSNKGKLILKQTELVEEFTRTKKPIIIFDSQASMTEKEYSWLKKFNVVFFEPYLNHRRGFRYLPFWLKIKTLNGIQFCNWKRTPLGYKGSISDRIQAFDKYYVSEMYGGLEVNYDADIRHENNYVDFSVKKKPIEFCDLKATILINTFNQNMCGYLHSDFVKALENNCIPLIPIENRYYNAFESIVENDFSVWYNVKSYDLCYVGIIHQIYVDIKNYYPEMDVVYTANLIKNYLSDM